MIIGTTDQLVTIIAVAVVGGVIALLLYLIKNRRVKLIVGTIILTSFGVLFAVVSVLAFKDGIIGLGIIFALVALVLFANVPDLVKKIMK